MTWSSYKITKRESKPFYYLHSFLLPICICKPNPGPNIGRDRMRTSPHCLIAHEAVMKSWKGALTTCRQVVVRDPKGALRVILRITVREPINQGGAAPLPPCPRRGAGGMAAGAAIPPCPGGYRACQAVKGTLASARRAAPALDCPPDAPESRISHDRLRSRSLPAPRPSRCPRGLHAPTSAGTNSRPEACQAKAVKGA